MTEETTMVRVDRALYERADRLKPGYLSKAAFINTLIEKGLSTYGQERRRSDYKPRLSQHHCSSVAG